MNGTLDSRANLIGKTAVVIGGGKGIGAASALALAEAGVDLVIGDVDGEALDDIAVQVRALGRTVNSAEVDVVDPASLEAFYAFVEEKAYRLDIVLNVPGGTRRVDFLEGTSASARRDIRLNYEYVVESVRAAARIMRRMESSGSIINFTTIEAHRGAATYSVYAGAKAATTNFTRAVAVELGKYGIRINCIAPDTTETPGSKNGLQSNARGAMDALSPETQLAGFKMYIPMKQRPPAEAIGNAVLFLASDLAAFVTGTTLHVDGGTMAASGFLDWPFGDGHLCVPLGGTLSRMYPDG